MLIVGKALGLIVVISGTVRCSSALIVCNSSPRCPPAVKCSPHRSPQNGRRRIHNRAGGPWVQPPSNHLSLMLDSLLIRPQRQRQGARGAGGEGASTGAFMVTAAKHSRHRLVLCCGHCRLVPRQRSGVLAALSLRPLRCGF